MTNPLYSELQVLAEELLAEFGRDIVFTRLEKSGVVDVLESTVAEPVEATQTLKVAILPASGGTLEAFDVRFMSNIQDSTNVRFGICAARQSNGNAVLFEPAPGDKAFFEGRSWDVMGNTPLNVDGTPVIFSVGFRGP